MTDKTYEIVDRAENPRIARNYGGTNHRCSRWTKISSERENRDETLNNLLPRCSPNKNANFDRGAKYFPTNESKFHRPINAARQSPCVGFFSSFFLRSSFFIRVTFSINDRKINNFPIARCSSNENTNANFNRETKGFATKRKHRLANARYESSAFIRRLSFERNVVRLRHDGHR